MPRDIPLGRTASLVEALTQHYDDLVAQLRRRFRDPDFAREVVNEVCVQLLEKPPAQDVHTPRAFLRRLALHRAIDRYRSQRLHASWVQVADELPETAATTELPLSGPELAVAVAQRQGQLLAAIQALPPRSQEVFILTQLYHMPQEEAGAHLGISRGMVARHLARALQDVAPVLYRQD